MEVLAKIFTFAALGLCAIGLMIVILMIVALSHRTRLIFSKKSGRK